MQRIAMFLPSLEGGGAERTFTNIANGLAALGHPVDMILKKGAAFFFPSFRRGST